MARVVAAETVMTRRPLLFFVAHAGDRQTPAMTASLAALALRAGWTFDCYVDRRRSGRHFGGGDPDDMSEEAWGGSLVAGAHHAEHVLWLATRYDIAAVGDEHSPLWPAFDAVGADVLARTSDPVDVYTGALARLALETPTDVFVLDATPQGPQRIVTAPYAAPAFLVGAPAIGLDVSSGEGLRGRIEELGGKRFRAVSVDAARARAFPGGVDEHTADAGTSDYATYTARMAETHRGWGRGVLLGGPDLVTAQIPKLARLHLVPIHSRPQTECLARCESIVRSAREPVYGVQYDDHDFFALGRLGHGLQVIDPDPPFDAAVALDAALPEPPTALEESEPADEELERWADEGRVLVSLLFWAGMIRELDCITRILDLVTATGLRGGLLVTAETVEHGGAYPLSLLSIDTARGGAFGLLEPLLACTGRGVAAEGLMSPATLGEHLSEAAAVVAQRVPAGLRPLGWWPLFDTEPARRRMPIGWRDGKPVLLTIGRANPVTAAAAMEGGAETDPIETDEGASGHASRTELLRALAVKSGVRNVFGYRRPYDDTKPGRFLPEVARAVQGAGLRYMWTKAEFGTPHVVHRDGDFVALPFTAGRWDGWSPFYTLGSATDFRHAERRLLRRKQPGWLVSTIDSPLWAMSGEVWEHGSRLHELVTLAARGGDSGQLVNTTPNVVARYARLVDDRARNSG